MTKQPKQVAKGKPKCIKGTACGYSCISGKYTCSDKILKRDADALLAAAGVLRGDMTTSHRLRPALNSKKQSKYT